MSSEAFDPIAVAAGLDPYPVYERFRADDPVHRGLSQTPGQATCWYLFRYRDVLAALRDPRLGRERPLDPHQTADGQELSGWLLYRDPPYHTPVRAWLQESLGNRLVAELEPRIEALATSLLEPLRASRPFNFLTDFAEKLPAAVLADLIGFEGPEAEKVSGTIVQMVAPSCSRHREPFEGLLAAGRARSVLSHFLGRRLERPPPREARHDLASALIEARANHPDCASQDLVGNLIFLVTSGYEVSVSAVANGVLALLEVPGLLASLRSEERLVDRAVDETLRTQSPLQMVDRWVLEDLTIDGRTLRRGERVYPVLGAANRDPEKFPRPDCLDVSREDGPHLAFGSGTHACLGAALARALVRVAFRTLSNEYPKLRIASPPPRWYPDANFRILERLIVTNQTAT